jgi:hypothetical protein
MYLLNYDTMDNRQDSRLPAAQSEDIPFSASFGFVLRYWQDMKHSTWLAY